MKARWILLVIALVELATTQYLLFRVLVRHDNALEFMVTVDLNQYELLEGHHQILLKLGADRSWFEVPDSSGQMTWELKK